MVRVVNASSDIRLRVAYRDVASLLGEFTRSVGQGSVTLETVKPVQLGTRFIFELLAQDVGEKLEVVGEVIDVEVLENQRYRIGVRYNPLSNRETLDALIQHLLVKHEYERSRVHPRIPLSMRVSEEKPRCPTFQIRDFSLGGFRLELEHGVLPSAAAVGSPCLLEVWLRMGELILHGEIAWVSQPQHNPDGVVRGSIGVRFGRLRGGNLDMLEEILRLRGLPPPPWRARVSFGLDAVARMP